MVMEIDWKEIGLGVFAIISAGAVSLALKKLLPLRRPNRRRGGAVSAHAAIAFSVVTVIALITKNWFITGLSLILAYMIARSRIDSGEHYTYQVALGAIIGVLTPYLIFRYIGGSGRSESVSSKSRSSDHDNDSDRDQRRQADDHPELKLDDDDDDDLE